MTLGSVGLFMILTFVELEELECASCAPALLFGEAVVGVALVFGGFAHDQELR